MTNASVPVVACATLLCAGAALATTPPQQKCDYARIAAWKKYQSCVDGVVAKQAKGTTRKPDSGLGPPGGQRQRQCSDSPPSAPNSWDKFGDTGLQEYPGIHHYPQQECPLGTPCWVSEIVLLSVGESWLWQDYESAALATELRQYLTIHALITVHLLGGKHLGQIW